MTLPVRIRVLKGDDDLDALTVLLHRAYAALADQGMRFVASYQDTSVTRERACGPGVTCFVAVDPGGKFVGTISIAMQRGRAAANDRCPASYRRPDVAVAEQFAVDPDWQGRGIGARLLATATGFAIGRGYGELACDTSQRAVELISMYTRYGFRCVDRVDWDETNYQSVIMSLALHPSRRGGQNRIREETR